MDEARVLEAARRYRKALEEELELRAIKDTFCKELAELEKRSKAKWDEAALLEGELRIAIAGDLHLQSIL